MSVAASAAGTTLLRAQSARDSVRPGGALEPITVAAPERRTSPARTTLEAADLGQARLGAGLEEVLALVPGLSVQPRGSYAQDTRLVVRGAGSRAAFGVRGLTVFLDGVPQSLADGQANLSQVEMAAIERVEVVRGATAAYHGNAAGGVVALRTLAPDGPALTRLRVSGGSHGQLVASLALRRRVGRGGVIVSGTDTRQDGWREYSAGVLRQGALAAAWPMGTRSQAVLRVRASDLARAENPGALDSAQLRADPRQAQPRNLAFRAGKRAREWLGSVEVARADATSETGLIVWARTRTLDNPLPSAWVRLDRVEAGLRAGGRWPIWERGEQRVVLLAGFDAQRQRDERRNFANDSGRIGQTALLEQREIVGAVGARAALEAAPTPRALVTLAVRYDLVAFALTDHLVADGNASGQRDMDAVSVALGATRQVGAVTLHAGYGTAFETPTTTELSRPGQAGFDPALAPQRTGQWEIGARWRRRRAELAVAAYRSAVRDALVPREDPTAPGRFRFVNAAHVRLVGVEIEARARLMAWLGLVATGTWTDHRYRRFPTDSVALDGRRLPGVPRWFGAVRASAGAPRGPHAEIELVHSARAWTDDSNSASAAPWAMVHVRAAWRGRPVVPFVGVRNAGDRRAVGAINVNGAFRRYFEPAPGRVWYLGLQVERVSR